MRHQNQLRSKRGRHYTLKSPSRIIQPFDPTRTASREIAKNTPQLRKLGYFRVPSIVHYLIVDPEKPRIIHHARGVGETILTRIVTAENIVLEASGFVIAVADIYST